MSETSKEMLGDRNRLLGLFLERKMMMMMMMMIIIIIIIIINNNKLN